MPISSDDLSIWNDLGTIEPIYNQWVVFPVQSNGGNAVFRVRWICVDFDQIRSYVWVRSRFQTQQSNQVTQAIRLYPKSDDQIFEMPIPQDLLDRGIRLRSVEVKKYIQSLRYVGIVPDIAYSMRLEEIL